MRLVVPDREKLHGSSFNMGSDNDHWGVCNPLYVRILLLAYALRAVIEIIHEESSCTIV